MATALQIANGALIKIGARTVLSLTGPEKEAKVCTERFEACKQAVLRMYPWNFAKQRVLLNVSAFTPAFGYQNAYLLPTDFLRVILINEGDELWSVENGHILSDSSEIRLRYVYNIDKDLSTDPMFDESLSCYLAWDISYYLTQSADVRDAMWVLFNKVVPIARHTNSTENSTSIVEANDFIESRMNSGKYVRDPMT